MKQDDLIIYPRLPGEDGYKTFSIRIREEVVSRIDDIATKTNRSRNELIGTFLEYALERCVIENAKE